ncbi:MAG TPA: EAL domain-containing response regulator [Candidatus Acidoferrum sp.]|nr:EAL domain-containing response regulator [Candidatus Acidoferrum sp.]
MTLPELRILIVEDDPGQRQLVGRMLRALGVHALDEAGDGEQAIRKIQQAVTAPDIVLCDLNMPGMDGLEFLRHLGEQRHDIAVVIISGLSSKLLDSAGRMTRLHGIKLLGVLEKPVSLEQLKQLLLQYQRSEPKHYAPRMPATGFTLDEIREGIRAGQFEPYFQPKVDLKSGKVTGAEALARWNHPQQGVIGPNEYIPKLEKTGNIEDLTFLMLERAALACRLLRESGHALTIAVNLSLISLVDVSLANKITRVVCDAGIKPDNIVLEITESAAMTDNPHALENLVRLRMNGFTLSIDDYGTGYSSLQQLTRIDFGELKIDQSFVHDCADNDSLRIMVESSIEMARKLHVRSVAEGVETKRDWDVLKRMGCDIVQGHYIAKPMDLAAFIGFCAAPHAYA